MTNLVICQACGASIYYCSLVGRAYTGTPVSASDMTPAHEDIPQPLDEDPMACPRCEELYGIPVGEKEIVLKLEDGSYWPYPPTNI
jgi:hypothetical protein